MIPGNYFRNKHIDLTKGSDCANSTLMNREFLAFKAFANDHQNFPFFECLWSLRRSSSGDSNQLTYSTQIAK